MRRDLIVINNFYKNPQAVVNYAKNLKFYSPYQLKSDLLQKGLKPTWITSRFTPFKTCPFRSSEKLIATIEDIIGETIDRKYWDRDITVPEGITEDDFYDNFRTYTRKLVSDHEKNNPEILPSDLQPSLWNCCFQVKTKYDTSQAIHNHVNDFWQCTGETGWNGIIYLNDKAPERTGIKFWKNRFGNDLEWMTENERWDMVDDLGNVFNRLILFRGTTPHSGAPGFGETIEDGRLFQTFFFRVSDPKVMDQISF